MTEPRSCDVRNIRRLLLMRKAGMSEHGRDQWAELLRRELAKLDREIKPKAERVYVLNRLRDALVHEIAEVANEPEAVV